MGVRTSLTKNTFKIGEHQLSLITGDMGGSFGMKGSIYPEIPRSDEPQSASVGQ